MQGFAKYPVIQLEKYLFGMYLIYSVTLIIRDTDMANSKKPQN